MKTIIKILLLLFIGFSAKANSLDSIPSGFPAPYSQAWYRIGTMMPDTLFVNPRRDTNFIPRFAGSQVFWQHPGSDSNIWISDGRRFFHYLKSGADVTNALGFTPIGNVTGFITAGANVTLTGLGTLASPYVIGSTAAGTGTVQQFIFNNGNGIVGTVTSPTVNPSLSLGTNITGVVYANGTGFSALGIGSGLNLVGNTLSANGGTSLTGVIVGDGSAFNAATIGAGLAYNTGTKTLSNTITNNNQLTNGNNYISNITGLVTAGTNVTVSGLGTAGSPYVINSSASGAITGSGNLSPLFTTSVVSNTITYSLSNAAGNTVFGNNTGSSAAPIYYVPNATTLNGWFGQTIGTVTSITGGSGILGGTITTSGTFKADTSLLGTQYDLTLKQSALSGTGFVIFSGTTPSYLTGTSSQFVKANGSLDGNSYFYSIATLNTGTPGSNGITNVAGTLYPQTASATYPGFETPSQFSFVDSLQRGLKQDTTFIRFTPTTSNGAQYLSANNDTIYAKKFIAGTNLTIDSTTTPGALIFNATGGGGGGTNANFGYGYRLVAATPTNIKTLFHGFGGTIDSTTNTNALTIIDTVTHISTLTNDAGYITPSSTNTLTNKSISGSSNTITNVSLTTGVIGVLPVANGGTNLSSFTNGGIFYASSSSVMGQISLPAHAGMRLTSTGTTSYQWNDTTAGGGGSQTLQQTLGFGNTFTQNQIYADSVDSNTNSTFLNIRPTNYLTSYTSPTYPLAGKQMGWSMGIGKFNVNPDGRPNDVLFFNYNLSAGAARIDTGDAGFSIFRTESHYDLGSLPYAPVQEFHMFEYHSKDGTSERLQSWYVPTGNGAAILDFDGEASIAWNSKLEDTAFLVFSKSGFSEQFNLSSGNTNYLSWGNPVTQNGLTMSMSDAGLNLFEGTTSGNKANSAFIFNEGLRILDSGTTNSSQGGVNIQSYSTSSTGETITALGTRTTAYNGLQIVGNTTNLLTSTLVNNSTNTSSVAQNSVWSSGGMAEFLMYNNGVGSGNAYFSLQYNTNPSGPKQGYIQIGPTISSKAMTFDPGQNIGIGTGTAVPLYPLEILNTAASQFGISYDATHHATFGVTSAAILNIGGIYGLTVPTAALPTGASTDSMLVVTNSSGTSTVKAVAQTTLVVATYTPTLTNTTNITSSGLGQATYTQVGNIVTVTIGGTITPTTGATASTLTITLPVSTATSVQQYCGNISISPNSNLVAGYSGVGGTTGSTTANINFNTPSTVGASVFNIVITYHTN